MLQMLCGFIQHQLTLTATHPPFDEATAAAGSRRFDKMLVEALKGVETTRNMSRRPVPPSSPSEPAS